MKTERRTILALVVVVVTVLIAFGVKYYDEGLIDFADSETIMFFGKCALLFIVLIAIIVALIIYETKGYNPEKRMKRLKKNKRHTLKGLCYFMVPSAFKILIHLRVTIVGCVVIMLPCLFGIYWLFSMEAMLLLALLANFIFVIYIREFGAKKVLEESSFFFKGFYGAQSERLNMSIKKGLLLKEQHLIVTEGYFICDYLAMPLDQIESFYLQENRPSTRYSKLIRMQEVYTMCLYCKLTSGKLLSLSLGSDEIELSHIKKFLEYYSEINPQIQEKYQGFKEMYRLH